MDIVRAFFLQNQDTLFDFQKRVGEASPLPSHPLVARVIWKERFYMKVFGKSESTLQKCDIKSRYTT